MGFGFRDIHVVQGIGRPPDRKGRQTQFAGNVQGRAIHGDHERTFGMEELIKFPDLVFAGPVQNPSLFFGFREVLFYKMLIFIVVSRSSTKSNLITGLR